MIALDWTLIDWSKSNRQISRETGADQGTVARQRANPRDNSGHVPTHNGTLSFKRSEAFALLRLLNGTTRDGELDSVHRKVGALVRAKVSRG